MSEEYREGKSYQLLLDSRAVSGIVDDWYDAGTKTDLRIRRAKTPGCAVIETGDVIFARRIQMAYPEVRVHIKG